MKKTLLLAAVAVSALAANAEVFNYGFQSATENAEMPFLNCFADENSDYYFPSGNWDLVDKYGLVQPNIDGVAGIATPDGAAKGVPALGYGISMFDGKIYMVDAEAAALNDPDAFGDFQEYGELTPELAKYPFLSWGEKGITRTIWMRGWGTEDAWTDDNYNAINADTWIPCKNGVQFTRLGTQEMVSRQDTYFQYPAVTGNVTVTVYASTNLGGTANPDNILEVLVTPVFDGVADADQAVVLSQDNPADKRYYKFTTTFDATGKELAVRVGPNAALINLMYVSIEGDAVGSEGSIGNIIADENNVNAPVYNVLGQQVNDSYKGLVIKNGKKFIRK